MLNTEVKFNSPKTYVREWSYPLLFLVFSLLLEMVNFLTLGFGVLPEYIVFDLAGIFIVLGLLSLMKTGKTAWICVASFILFFQALLNMVSATLYDVFGEVFSLSLLFLGAEGTNAFKFEFLDMVSITVNLVIWLLFVFTCVYLNKNTENGIVLSKQSKFTFVLSAFIALQACGLCLFNGQIGVIRMNADAQATDSEITFTDEELWDNLYLKNEAMKQFGTYGFYIKNVGNFFFGGTTITKEEEVKVASALDAGKGYKVQSAYSGIAKGDNLIYIMLESFDNFSIDPIYTPFLWNMRMGNYDGAQYMNSFYADNKTNISEGISILGHIANEKLYSSYYSSVGITAPYSIANLMRNDGVEAVNYFHGYSKKFYDRVHVNKAYGFDNVYALEDCTLENKTIKFGDWIRDSQFIDNMKDKFMPQDVDRFFSFYTTISTHGPYDWDNSRISDNLQYVRDHYAEYTEYAESIGLVMPTDALEKRKYQQFKAFTMDTDQMVRYIFETLEAQGMLENTTVVMFADHNAYYSDLCYHIKGIAKNDYSNVEANHLPCIIYNDQLPKGVNNTFCSTYDLYPTICDMFDIEYNSALTQGYSTFSDEAVNSVFVSSLSGMQTNKMFTNNIADVVVLDPSCTKEDVRAFQERLMNFYDKQEIIELIYKCNYFKDKEVIL